MRIRICVGKPIFRRTKMERNNIFSTINRYAMRLKLEYNGDMYCKREDVFTILEDLDEYQYISGKCNIHFQYVGPVHHRFMYSLPDR
jgi:hypothetical protein